MASQENPWNYINGISSFLQESLAIRNFKKMGVKKKENMIHRILGDI